MNLLFEMLVELFILADGVAMMIMIRGEKKQCNDAQSTQTH
jgi:hypothetical protein